MSKREVFLSPHLDDVVYSCGGTLGMHARDRPLVVTIFAGEPEPGAVLSPAAHHKHTKMGTEDAHQSMAWRRCEDVAALGEFGVEHLWLDYPDALYRGDPPLYPRRDQYLGGEVHADDASLVDRLADDLALIERRSSGSFHWYAPMGIGRHVDHQIVCAVGRTLSRHGSWVTYYEDMPYALVDGAIAACRGELDSDLYPVLVDVAATMHVRIEAALMYQSQLGGNFGTEAALRRDLRNYAVSLDPSRCTPCERFWQETRRGL
jgi:LmbE family N-acetylglucosaminyl deacetylase